MIVIRSIITDMISDDDTIDMAMLLTSSSIIGWRYTEVMTGMTTTNMIVNRIPPKNDFASSFTSYGNGGMNHKCIVEHEKMERGWRKKFRDLAQRSPRSPSLSGRYLSVT